MPMFSGQQGNVAVVQGRSRATNSVKTPHYRTARKSGLHNPRKKTNDSILSNDPDYFKLDFN